MAFPYSASFSTPQQRRPSDPTWIRTPPTGVFTPSRSSLQTPHSGKKSNPRTTEFRYNPLKKKNPLATPEKARVTIGNGKTQPFEVFKPKDLYNLTQRKIANSKSSPMTPPTSSTTTPGRARRPMSKRRDQLLPPGLESPPTTLVSPPIQGTRRREPDKRPRDPARPTVQLLEVLNKCVSDDGVKDSDWTVTNGLLNGRNEDRDRSRMWNTLDCAVSRVWPELKGWIMRNTPFSNDYEWFSSTSTIDDYHRYIYDPDLATKDSSLDRVGFRMTPSAYDAACKIVKRISCSDRQSLANGEINPFFVIYACADSGVPLPDNFNRQLLWKHLDATLRAKCWRALGPARANIHHTRADADHVPPKIFRKGEEDPDDILKSLLKVSCSRWRDSPDPTAEAADVPRPVHKLDITMNDYRWVAKTELGTVWYEAGDLYDDDDIACLAVIDSLTRLLPSCRGGILEISAADIRLLWGVGGAVPSGACAAWSVVQAVCAKYDVNLRGKWTKPDPRGPNPWMKLEPTEITVPPRDRDVVDLVVNEFMQKRLDSKVACQRMVEHLRVET